MTAAAGCSRRHDPPPAVRAKQTACHVRGPTRSPERHSRSSLKVQGRRSRGWAWRSLFVGSSPTGAIRCGGGQSQSPPDSPHWDSLTYRFLAGLASCPVRRERSGAHGSGCGHPFVPLRRDAERSRAATSTGRHSPVCHGARFSFALVGARDCDGVCFGQLTCATRLPEPLPPAPTDLPFGPSPLTNMIKIIQAFSKH